jgi:NAD+ kinase
MKVKTVGVLQKKENTRATEVSKKLIPWLEKKGCQIETENFSKTDLLLTLGGDGTFIKGIRMLDGAKVPVLGIRLGQVGFMTQLSPDEFEPILEKIIKEGPTVEERIKVKAQVLRQNQGVMSFHALNDAVLHTTGIARVSNYKVSLNGDYFSTLKADGVMVATPTGSTAYSFAAGGPIIEPHHPLLVFTPICPQNMSNRPMVVSDQSLIEIELEKPNAEILLTVDGQDSFELKPADRIQMQRSDQKAYFVQLPDFNYFEVLRKKLF